MSKVQDDHFSTPRNALFYKKFVYPSLTPDAHEIRLLKINALGPEKHSLISNVPLAYAPRYTALSYCAGDPSKTSTISVDGITFNAFVTLAAAIGDACRFHHDNSPNATLYLWADQICINQSDPAERTRQVNFMREIYSRAQSVLISLPLNPTLYEPHLLLSNLRLMLSLTSEDFNSSELGLQRGNAENVTYMLYWGVVSAIVRSPWWQRAWIFQEFMMADRACFMVRDESATGSFVAVQWKPLQSLLQTFDAVRQNYIEVLQGLPIITEKKEFADNEQFRFHVSDLLPEPQEPDASEMLSLRSQYHAAVNDYRNTETKGFEIFDMWFNLSNSNRRTARRATRSALSDKMKNLAIRSQNASEVFSKASADWHNHNEEKRQLANTQSFYHRGPYKSIAATNEARRNQKKVVESALKGLIPDLESKWHLVNFILTSKNTYDRDTPIKLSSLMNHAQNCLSSDPRDKIYAFLGLADPRCPIEPAYDVSLNVARIRLIKAMIAEEGDLTVIMKAWENVDITTTNDPLPSWAPDWSNNVDRVSQYKKFRKITGIDTFGSPAGGDTPPVVRFQRDRYGNSDRILEIVCLYVDTLGKLIHDDDDMAKHFEGKNHGSTLGIVAEGRSQRGDEVWIMLGGKEPLLLRRYGSELTIIGPVMLMELGEDGQYSPSSIMSGSLYDRYLRGEEVRCEKLRII